MGLEDTHYSVYAIRYYMMQFIQSTFASSELSPPHALIGLPWLCCYRPR